MDSSLFSSAVRELLVPERVPDLGPGHANEGLRSRLDALTVEDVFAPAPVRRHDCALACLAGLWLYHDFLDESHELSQGIDGAEGSFWHGIMHRREPDYSNAAYWFRQVGRHPVFEALGPAAQELAAAAATRIAVPAPWDPFWFIDFCKACVQRHEPGEELAQLLQKKEWELLFTHCYRQALA